MDILIIALLIYLIMLYLSSKIKKDSSKYKTVYYVLINLSIIMVLIGCLTPFSIVYAFVISYGILILNFILSKTFNKNDVDSIKNRASE